MIKKFIFGVLCVLVVLGVAGFLLRDDIKLWFFEPTDSTVQNGIETSQEIPEIEVVQKGLDTPWGIAFLPSGDYLVTERKGTLLRIGVNGASYEIDGVKESSEGGLLGIALHPDFAENNLVYLYLTTEAKNGLVNRIEQFKLEGDVLTQVTTILSDIPGAQIHDGGRIAFGPDEMLYVTTGDAGNEDNAQDKESLAGKILRMTDSGGVPDDNPFGNYTYSYGHRNPQGIAWDDVGRLWSSEHGPSGSQSGNDELNLIEKGGNYGWPIIKGQETKEGMIAPIAESGTDETWAPGSLTFADGSLFFAGLRGQALYQAKIDGTSVELTAHLREIYGRLRTVHAQNGFLYLLTSNQDGRGEPTEDDDRIVKIPLQNFR